MIICGDIALSKRGAVKINGLPGDLKSKVWFGNLEGTLVDVNDANRPFLLQEHGVFNDYYAIKELTNELNFCGFGIANNHIHNYGNPERTINYLRRMGKNHAGAGKDDVSASEPAVVKDNNGEYYNILAFASKLTGSKVAERDSEGVNPWTGKQAKDLVAQMAGGGYKQIVFVHWNYEMNYLPFPYDRQLAHELIDEGATAVIGCHSHRTAPVEIYKGKPIIYGLGNFLFENNTYFNGQLNFPKISEEEFAFEIDDEGLYKIHVFHYDTQKNLLEYIRTEDLTEQEGIIKNLTGLSADDYEKQYKEYFKSKPRRQRILCPIFKTHESQFSYWTKEKERDLHELFLKAVLKLRLHGSSKSGKEYR